mmetsp:Transcript_30683/g.53028  ORF Transcript_30683/g.53028 Transcript_30683/m.53028 type:complete len:391 (+) Transcript_30683:1-1173(+)
MASHIPRRTEDLNKGGSTRYDHLVAAPSDEQLVLIWSVWASIAFAVGILSFIVFLGILSSKRTCHQPFNLYLVYLMIPDFVFSLCCSVTCLLNAISGSYWSHWMCSFQQFYAVFGIGANAWLNGVVAYQLHRMMKDSKAIRRFRPPTLSEVTKNALTVYLWCLFLASWGLHGTSSFPYYTGLRSGVACLPSEIDQASTIMLWAVFFPLFVGLPLMYVVWVSFDVYYHKLMPPTGQGRLLTIYFGRIELVFIVMWIPSLVLMFLVANIRLGVIGGTWSHLQGAVSALVSLLKPDIREAVKHFVTCHFYGHKKGTHRRQSVSCKFQSKDNRRSSLSQVSRYRVPNSQDFCAAPQSRAIGNEHGFCDNKDEHEKSIAVVGDISLGKHRRIHPN